MKYKTPVCKINTDIPTSTNREIMKVLANHQWFRAFDKAEDRLGNLEKGVSLGWSVETITNGKEELESILNFYGNSILYNLHTTDGAIEIENKRYNDKESEAKIFQSKKTHRGIGPTCDKVRFNLNIIFKKI